MLKILKPEEYITCSAPIEAEKPDCPWYNGGAIYRRAKDGCSEEIVAYSTSPEDNKALDNYRDKIDPYNPNDLTPDGYYIQKYNIEFGKGWFWLSAEIIRKEREKENKQEATSTEELTNNK